MVAPDVTLELCFSKGEADRRENYWAGVVMRLGGANVCGITQEPAGKDKYRIIISFYVDKTDKKFLEFMIKMRREMR